MIYVMSYLEVTLFPEGGLVKKGIFSSVEYHCYPIIL